MPLRDEIADRVCFESLGGAVRAKAPQASFDDASGPDARAAAGLAVYRNNVRAAYLRALTDAFPVVRRLVGEEFFKFLAHEYFDACPPRSPLVARYGDEMPTFLEGFDPVKGLPYLPDVARIEIGWLRAYHSPEATSLSPQEISSSIHGEASSARFELHPSLQLIGSRFPAHTIWEHNRARTAGRLRAPAMGEYVLIVRPEAAVVARTVPEPVFLAVRSLAEGFTLAEALERFSSGPDAQLLADMLKEIFSMRIVIDVEAEGSAA